MEHSYQNMKSLFVVLIFITSIVTNYADVQTENSDENWVVIQNEDCGPSSFSHNVENAFLREISRIDLESNLYKMLTCPMYNCPNDN